MFALRPGRESVPFGDGEGAGEEARRGAGCPAPGEVGMGSEDEGRTRRNSLTEMD